MKYLLFTFTVCLLISCGDQKETVDMDEMVDLAELRQQIATHITNDLILPAYQDLSIKAVLLQEASVAFSENMEENNLVSLRATHKDFWLSWQKASLAYFGPTVNNGLRGCRRFTRA